MAGARRFWRGLRRWCAGTGSAADQAECEVRQVVGGLDQGDQDRRVRLVDQQPLGAHGLHPCGDVAGQDGEPEGSKDAVAKRCPGRDGRAGGAHPSSRALLHSGTRNDAGRSPLSIL